MSVQEIVNGWLFDYVGYITWHEFSTKGEVGKEIRRFLDCIWESGSSFDCNIRDRRNLLLLVQILCALSDEVHHDALAHVIEVFDMLFSPDKGPPIDREMVTKTRRMLIAEAVLVCCKDGDFEKAREVYQHHQVDFDEEDDKSKIILGILELEEEKPPDFYEQSYKQFSDQIVLLLCCTYESFKTPMLIEAGEKYIQVYTEHTKQYESDRGDDASDEASKKSSPLPMTEKQPLATRSASSNLLKSSTSSNSGASTKAAVMQQNRKPAKRKTRSEKSTSLEPTEKRVVSPGAANEMVLSARKNKATPPKRRRKLRSGEDSLCAEAGIENFDSPNCTASGSDVSQSQAKKSGSEVKSSASNKNSTPKSNPRLNKENCNIDDNSSNSPKPAVKRASKRKLFNEENEEAFEFSSISDDEQEPNTPAFFNRINFEASTSRRQRSTSRSGSEVESNSSQQGSPSRADCSRRDRGKYPRKRRRWTTDEEIRFFKAVKKYGEGKWRRILSVCKFPHRTNVNLKDKWRSMQQTGQVANFENMFSEERS